MKTKALMTAHLWTSVVLGVQLLLWSVSGLYFSLWGHQALMAHQHFQQPSYRQAVTLPDSLPDIPEVSGTLLRQTLMPRGERWQWRLTTDEKTYYLDALSLVPWQTSAQEARAMGKASYRGEANVTHVHLYPHAHPDLIGRTDAMYEVAFDDALRTRAYVSVATGDVLTHRNKYWRLHDWMFRLHFMDYSGQRDFNNALIVIAAGGTLWFVLTGILVSLRVFRR
ncbi:MAG: PepSY domain-containing protein [Idiomarina sp.]|nr:PepSY domain-containing protein [Idiomarina sp.]